MHIKLRISPHADRYLRHRSALGAAYCDGTILLDSLLLSGVNAGALQLILAHEIAHCMQFQNADGLASNLAEGEAWRASSEIADGSVPQTRFRPVHCPALATGVYIATFEEGYYSEYPHEPIGHLSPDVRVDSHIMLGADTNNLLGLLERLSGLQPGSDVVLVAHGSANGLTMPLVNVRGPIHPQPDTQVLSRLMDESRTPENIEQMFLDTYPDRSVVGRPTAEQITQIRAARNVVIAKRFGRIDFRACSIGYHGPDVPFHLPVLRQFLGSRYASAPDITNDYGVVTLHLGEHRRPPSPGPLVRVWTSPEGRRVVSQLRGDNLHVFVDADRDFDDWRHAMFGSGTATSRLSYHVMSGPGAGEGILFPNEDAYVNHIVTEPVAS